jgi:SHS2 domain-containing protein
VDAMGKLHACHYGRKAMSDIPTHIDTELGDADISFITADKATKEYLCPFCDEKIQIGEPHLLIVPKVADKLRRHVHIDCVKTSMQFNIRMKLHPNEPHAATYHL